MKACVKATGQVVDIIRNSAFDKDVFYDSNGQKYNREELSFDFKEKSFLKDDPDYWTRLEHTYVGMFMKSFLDNFDGTTSMEILADDAIKLAHALVEKLKEKEE